MKIPKEVKEIIQKLEKKGFEAYVVGGCVRDILQKQEPKDWDIATSAKPEEIQKLFPDNFYENRFMTVTVLTKSKKESLKEIEITTYRSEAKYKNKRHPEQVKFAKKLEDDLSRRDFTINAIALEIKEKDKLIDPFDGQKALKEKIIRTVRDPNERFDEDALRMMRAVRFYATLGEGWEIGEKTKEAIKNNSKSLECISKERIRDELIKIIMSPKAEEAINLLHELNLLQYIISELEEGCDIPQNKHHIYGCYEHSLKSLGFACKKNFSFYVRMASLFHDIAKPRTKRGKGENATFYGHEVIGARMTQKIMERLAFPRKDIDKVVNLVRCHLFYYNVGEVTESSVRRLIRKAGTENMEELLQLRQADRIGSGVPKAEPYKLRHLKYTIEKVSKDPISAKMLKTSGEDVMRMLKIEPGPKVGQTLDILLGYVLLDPKKNKKPFLEEQIKKLGEMDEKGLASLAKKAKKERDEVATKEDKMTKEKYWVT